MKKGLVTVVVPIYNTEKYLDRCIGSIVNQTWRNLEILLIDDGSTDESLCLCQEWSVRDSRIKVFRQENAGAAMARNLGIRAATGEYIYFCDSDDFIEPEMISECYREAVKYDADMVCFGRKIVDAAGDSSRGYVPTPPRNVYCGDEIVAELLPGLIGPDPRTGESYNLSMSLWTKLFSSRVIKENNWQLTSEREVYSEEFYSLLYLYPKLKCVCILPKVYYNYCVNELSLSHGYRPGREALIRKFYEQVKSLCIQIGYGEEIVVRFRKPYLSFVIDILKKEMRSYQTTIEKIENIRKIINDDLLQKTLIEGRNDKVNWKQRILFRAMRKRRIALCCGLLWLQNKAKRY